MDTCGAVSPMHNESQSTAPLSFCVEEGSWGIKRMQEDEGGGVEGRGGGELSPNYMSMRPALSLYCQGF